LKVVLQGEYLDGTARQIEGLVGWSTTESKVARVNDNGQVSALQPGVAKIFADMAIDPLQLNHNRRQTRSARRN